MTASPSRRWRHGRRRPNIIPKEEFEAKVEAIRAGKDRERSVLEILQAMERRLDARHQAPHQDTP